MSDESLLMIPGPVEISPAVQAAFSVPPPSHTAPDLIAAFGSALERMRAVWKAPAGQPFIVAGSGTLAMEMAAANLVAAGDRVLVLKTGYFSDRMAEMLRRLGADLVEVEAEIGDAPDPEKVRQALGLYGGVRAVFATHVDTSTGVRLDPAPIARLARERRILSVFDGVCATAGEEFDMQGWGVDVYLTGSQKALAVPAGLALMVVSDRALEARRRLPGPPPLSLDWDAWLPIMKAYEEGRPSYFSTPATNLVLALDAALGEILERGLDETVDRHRQVAEGMRAAWAELALEAIPVRPELAANTLSALRFPSGVDGKLIAAIAERGVVVAGGLHPAIRQSYFRVGHLGHCVGQGEWLERTVRAVGEALADLGHEGDPEAAVAALSREIG
ncbi:MAG: alanine--glyoxylate aminotransferase family protein [Acidobacteriota bacterium]